MTEMEKIDLSMIASPSGNAAQSPFVNESINSMNNSFFLPRITQNEESFMSPAAKSPTIAGMDEFGISAKAMEAICAYVIQHMQAKANFNANFNTKAVEFFQNLEGRLEDIVDLKMNSSTYIESLQRNVSTPNTSQANPTIALEEKIRKFDEEYEDFIDKYSKLNKINDKIETTNETLSIEIDSVKADIVELEAGLRKIRLNADENLAKIVQESQSPPTESITKPLQQRVQGTELQCEQLSVQYDELNAYNRQYIAELHNIVRRGNRRHPERTTDVVIEFLWKFLGMRISSRDISICHRQDIPSLRKKMGRNYIMPIYCKFLNRTVVHEMMRRRHLLKNMRNEYNMPYTIHENLTPNRRLLWDSVQKKLGHFRFRWVKRGKIYVRERADSAVIQVISERVLTDLITKKTQVEASPQAPQGPIRNDPPDRVKQNDNSNKSKYTNRYASVVNSENFPRRSDYSRETQPKLPYYSDPIFSFRNKSFVNYRSSAF